MYLQKREMILISANDTKAEDINHFRARFDCVWGTRAEKKRLAVDSERTAFNKIGIDVRMVINKDNKTFFLSSLSQHEQQTFAEGKCLHATGTVCRFPSLNKTSSNLCI